MPKINSELVFVPKSSGIFRHGDLGGVCQTSLVFTPHKIYFLPIQIIAGAGMTVETRNYSFEGQSMHLGLAARLEKDASDLKTLEKDLEAWLDKNFGAEKEYYILDKASLKDFNVKAGWFILPGSLMFRSPKDNMRDAFSIPKKEAAELREFYGLQ